MTDGFVQAIRDHGWTIVDRVLDDEAVVAARAALDDVFAAEDEIADERGWLTDVHRVAYALPAKDQAFVEIATDPEVLAVARSVLGEDCALASCNGLDLVPGGPGQALHRDHPDPVDGATIYLHVVVALDDFEERNGATRLVPGSHRGSWSPGSPPPGDVRVATVGAGGAVVYDGSIVHGAGANRTDRPRRALHLFYARWWARPHWDLPASLPPAIVDGLSAEQRRVLGFDHRPRRFDLDARRAVR